MTLLIARGAKSLNQLDLFKSWQIDADIFMKQGVHQFWSVCGACLCCLATTSLTRAQIVPDATLPNNSSVTNQGNTGIISGGTVAGSNLFHSFEQFSVPTGSTAYFNNAPDIQNILTRVTGSFASKIDGKLQANGTANLFLLNPNGIMFGPNASLNIGGSFLASTASAVNFADGTHFDATAPQTTPLLTVSVPLGLQFGGTAGRIVNQSRSTNSSGGVGLQVQPGKTLALVGGDVSLEGGQLQALGGRVELGGLAAAGSVGLAINGSQGSLSFPDGVQRADVYLTSLNNKAARVNVAAFNGGSIAVTARNIEISGGSSLSGGIGRDLEFPGVTTARNKTLNATEASNDATAGDMTLNATEAINMANGFIANDVRTGSVGKGGNITITAGSLSLTDGAQLTANIEGNGNKGSVTIGDAGSVNINVHEGVSFDGTARTGNSSGAFSQVAKGAVGNSGSINITAGSLFVKNGAQLNATTRGKGNAGIVNINARDTVSFDGTARNGFSSAAYSQVAQGASGNGGSINIQTGSLFVNNGAQVSANTFGHGDAGIVNINARDTVSFDGTASNGFSSGAFSRVEREAVGNSGSINITTGSLFVKNGAQLNATTRGKGNAGIVNINARDTVSFDDVGRNGLSSGAFSQVRPGSEGNGGSINIKTGSLFVTNGAQLGASTVRKGDAGIVDIDARDTVSFDGVGSNQSASAAFSQVETGASGNGGDINIKTGSLFVTNGALLSASTFGQGDGSNITVNANTLSAINGGQILTTSRSSGKAGNITLNVTDKITLSGSDPTYRTRLVRLGDEVVFATGPASGLFASTFKNSTSQGGSLMITTGQLIVKDGAEVNVSSTGTGNAGNLEIASRDLLLDNRGAIRATTLSGEGGNIKLRKQDLILMRHNSEISTVARGTGNGGDIDIIDANLIVAFPSEDSDITANAFEGNGGRIQITAQGILGTQFREELTPESDITASSKFGVNGVVEINTPNLDPSRGLVTLPAQLVDASGMIAQGCRAAFRQGQSEFIVTGRGGLPPTPTDALNSDNVLEDWGTFALDSAQPQNSRQRDRTENHSSGSAVFTAPTAPEPAPIVEAQGWVINNKGEVVLTATVPTVTPYIPWMRPLTCHGS